MRERGVTFDPELSRGLGVGSSKVHTSCHVLPAVEEDQHVSGPLLLHLHVLGHRDRSSEAGIGGAGLHWLGGGAKRRSHSRRVQRLALQLPGAVDVLLRDLRLELGRLHLGHLHAVERPHHLDLPLCRRAFHREVREVTERSQRGRRGQSRQKNSEDGEDSALYSTDTPGEFQVGGSTNSQYSQYNTDTGIEYLENICHDTDTSCVCVYMTILFNLCVNVVQITERKSFYNE